MANLCFKTLSVERSRHGYGILPDRRDDDHALVFVVHSRHACVFVVRGIIHQRIVHLPRENAQRLHRAFSDPSIFAFRCHGRRARPSARLETVLAARR